MQKLISVHVKQRVAAVPSNPILSLAALNRISAVIGALEFADCCRKKKCCFGCLPVRDALLCRANIARVAVAQNQ